MFRYDLISKIRILLLLSIILFCIPFVLEGSYEPLSILLCYFFGSYFLFLNFPGIAEFLHQKPLYIEDLTISSDDQELDYKFHSLHVFVMNVILAILSSFFCEYIIIRDISDKPTAVIIAIVGGNISIYMNIQHVVGKFLIFIFHYMKTKEIRKRSLSNDVVEMIEKV